MINIKYVPKKEIYPYFGYAYPDQNTIKIRKDLPRPMKDFVLEHEKFHFTTAPDDTLLLVEIEATLSSAYKYPIGFILTVLYTIFSPMRLIEYIKRFIYGY